jgi:hypothetical protein
MITIVICPKCLTATRKSQFDTSPNNPGKRCWRCPGRYVEANIPDTHIDTSTPLLPVTGEHIDRILNAAAAALERAQVGDADEATALLEQVVELDGTYKERR